MGRQGDNDGKALIAEEEHKGPREGISLRMGQEAFYRHMHEKSSYEGHYERYKGDELNSFYLLVQPLIAALCFIPLAIASPFYFPSGSPFSISSDAIE